MKIKASGLETVRVQGKRGGQAQNIIQPQICAVQVDSDTHEQVRISINVPWKENDSHLKPASVVFLYERGA